MLNRSHNLSAISICKMLFKLLGKLLFLTVCFVVTSPWLFFIFLSFIMLLLLFQWFMFLLFDLPVFEASTIILSALIATIVFFLFVVTIDEDFWE